MADSFRFHPNAAREFEDAAAWYDERRPGLGAEFAAAVFELADQVAASPRRWRRVRKARRALLTRFPYAIVYREVPGGAIEIVAVAHLSRRPGYWSRR